MDGSRQNQNDNSENKENEDERAKREEEETDEEAEDDDEVTDLPDSGAESPGEIHLWLAPMPDAAPERPASYVLTPEVPFPSRGANFNESAENR